MAQEKIHKVGSEVYSFTELKPDWEDCGLRKVNVDAMVSHRPSQQKDLSKTATIEVDYGDGFTPEAREAFQRAVEVWEAHIESSVPIRVDASFGTLDTGVLGGAGPNLVYAADTNGDGENDTVFGDALIDAITEVDQQEGEPDIVATFNSDRDDWHFGEGDAPSGTIDFTSVVLHEIGHGLNYLGITNVDDDGVGEYGGVDFDGDGSSDGIPSVFTQFLVEEQPDGTRVPITNETVYPNPSEDLGEALTDEALFFEANMASAAADQSTGPVPPRIYAPFPYESGSSISHLKELTYPPDGVNALMTPQFNTGETVRLPGPIMCGQLADMGWPIGNECARLFQDVTSLQFAEGTNVQDGRVSLRWSVDTDADIDEFIVEQKYFDGDFEEVQRIDGAEGSDGSVMATLEDVGLGLYAYRIRWIYTDGSSETTSQQVEIEVNVADLAVEQKGEDEQGRGTVDVEWSVPPGTAGFTYQVQRTVGDEMAFVDVEQTSGQRTQEDRVTPGRYRYRVVSQDGQGNTLTSEAEEVEIDFDGDVFVVGPYPQPARDQVVTELTARESQNVSVEVYNAVGQRVFAEDRRLGAEEAERLNFDLQGWGSGLHFLRVTGDDFTITRKLMVLK